jgi:hypothetical protein
MRTGAVGKSRNADTNTVKLNAHIAKKGGVKRGSRDATGRAV